MHADAYDEAKILEKALIDKYGFKNTVIVDVGPIIGTHVGAGMLAFIFLSVSYKGKDMEINGGKMGEITSFLYDKITGIQSERYEDEFGWVTSAGVTTSSPMTKNIFIDPTSSTYLCSEESSHRA